VTYGASCKIRKEVNRAGGVGLRWGRSIAAGLMRLMRSLLFELSPLDPITYVAAPLLLIAAAAFAVTRSHRIVCLDPTQALKSE
jgi:putative ABC transport system permease protein